MSPVVFLLVACAVIGAVYAHTLRLSLRCPIGETMPKAWRPHPRTVVVADPVGEDA
jgi:hypothetical protein